MSEILCSTRVHGVVALFDEDSDLSISFDTTTHRRSQDFLRGEKSRWPLLVVDLNKYAESAKLNYFHPAILPLHPT